MADTSLAEKPAAAPRSKPSSAARDAILELKTRIGKSVLGQDRLVESMLMGLLANGSDLLGVNPYWQQVVIGAVIIAAVALDEWRKRRLSS